MFEFTQRSARSPRFIETARIAGYVIGKYRNEVYVIDDSKLMVWPKLTDHQSDATLGFPHEVPGEVHQYVVSLMAECQLLHRPSQPHARTMHASQREY